MSKKVNPKRDNKRHWIRWAGRTLRRCGPVIAVSLALALVGATGARCDEQTALQSGIAYYHDTPPGRSIHILAVDLCRNGLRFQATGPYDGTSTVSQFALKVGAIAAINGGHSNELFPGPTGPAAHAGVFFGGPDAADYGQVVFGDDRVRFVHMLTAFAAEPWMREVVSGLLSLVHDGRPLYDQLPQESYTCSEQHPRTLIGLSADRRTLLMVVVDGRRPELGMTGMTCAEAADYMVRLGAHWALNFDGGGSSTMWLNGSVVNSPSGGSERPIGSHLALVPDAAAKGYCRSFKAGRSTLLELILED